MKEYTGYVIILPGVLMHTFMYLLLYCIVYCIVLLYMSGETHFGVVSSNLKGLLIHSKFTYVH